MSSVILILLSSFIRRQDQTQHVERAGHEVGGEHDRQTDQPEAELRGTLEQRQEQQDQQAREKAVEDRDVDAHGSALFERQDAQVGGSRDALRGLQPVCLTDALDDRVCTVTRRILNGPVAPAALTEPDLLLHRHTLS
jgi:hypothetical protein